MRKALLTIFTFLFVLHAGAQVLNEDAKGNSTLLYQGTVAGLNFADASLQFTYNNFAKNNIGIAKSKFFYGVTLKGKNKDGVAGVFGGGNVVPEASGKVTFGLSWASESLKLSNAHSEVAAKIATGDAAFITKLKADVHTHLEAQGLDADTHDRLRKDLDAAFDLRTERISARIKNLDKTYAAQAAFLTSEAAAIDARMKSYYGSKARKDDAAEEARLRKLIDSKHATEWHRRVSIFLTAGASASSFKYVEAINATNFASSFTNKSFSGGSLGIGFNYQRGGKWLYGFTASVEHANNFDALTKSEYTIRNVQTSGTQQLISEQKFTAYSGNYGRFNKVPVNLDIVRFTEFGTDGVIAWDTYLRYTGSLQKNIFPETTDVGVSAFFFKDSGPFLGGLFIELPDVTNNIESAKEKPDLMPISQRLVFGIVAKVTFGSILRY